MIEAYRCDKCKYVWIARQEEALPVQCPRRKCRSRRWNDGMEVTVLAGGVKPGEKPKATPSTSTLPLSEAREPKWLRDSTLPRTLTNKKCHTCSAKVEIVYLEDENRNIPVCLGPGRHLQ